MVFYPKWSMTEIEGALALYNEGKSYAEISRVFGRTPDACKKIIHRYNVAPQTYNNDTRNRPRTPESDCTLHLVDLMRMFAKKGEELGDAKARYRERCELDIDPGYRLVTAAVQPYHIERSYVGSQFADVG